MSLKLYLDAISDFCQYKVKQIYIIISLFSNLFYYNCDKCQTIINIHDMYYKSLLQILSYRALFI